MRFALLFLAASFAGCTPSAPGPLAPEASRSPQALAGTYHVDHEVGVFDGTEFVPRPTTDRLAIVPSGDSLDVSLVLIHTNAHICEMHTRLGREGTAWVSQGEPLDFDDATCTLRLIAERDTLRLHDVGNACRRTYCGARGVIDGAAFPRASRDPDTSWRDDLR